MEKNCYKIGSIYWKKLKNLPVLLFMYIGEHCYPHCNKQSAKEDTAL